MYKDTRNVSPHIDAVSQAKLGLMPFPDKLYVVTPIVNSQRYVRRYELYRAFEKSVGDAGALLYTAELAFGGREFEITDRSNPMHLQFRTTHEMWYKENLINLAIARLPPEAKYIAWVDADISFVRPDWAQETLHQLQHFHFVQMFSDIIQLSHSSEILNQGVGFVEGWKRGIPFKTKAGQAADNSFYRRRAAIKQDGGYPYGGLPKAMGGGAGWAGSPGGAWAARREALDAVGGLIDYAVLGSADYHMATGLMGFMKLSLAAGYHPEYIRMLMKWQDDAIEHVKRNVGHVYGTVFHHWHGKMSNRGYNDRWKILVKHGFNPFTDLKRDSSGLWQLTDKKWQLRDDIRSYFGSRNEDEIG